MKKIYLDNAATTKVNENVAKRVMEFSLEDYANASSKHSPGLKVRDEIESARARIAKFIGADAYEIVFTSGGTESNNLALRGLAIANPDKKHIITSVIEHPSVLETCKHLEKEGYRVSYVEVDSDGTVKADEIKKLINKDTLVVSIMHVNNEIGTIQPIEEIGKICSGRGVYFHSDAVQSFAKIPLNVSKMNVDLISVSGHKIHAPKGIGFLYVRQGTLIKPIIYGGGQERGLRSGTLNSAGIVGLAEAVKIKRDITGVKKVRDELIRRLKEIPGTKINGSLEKRIYHNVNVSFYGIEGESLMLLLDKDGIFVSTGSACASNKLEESHVLKAIGADEMYIHGSIRMSLDEDSGKNLDFIVDAVKRNVEKLRSISPFKFELEVTKSVAGRNGKEKN